MLTPGTKLGPYEILASIGAGGMGEVYRARDTRLGREVAIKILPPELASNSERLQRFEQEARLVGALNHPNILGIFDVGAADRMHYLVSELLEGQSLRDRMRSTAPSRRKSLELAVQIANGLAAAHERGIVHRDLKPENIFVTTDGRVKVLDFGLAKLSPSAAVASMNETVTAAGAQTREGVVLGTVGYMSPEQVRGNPADHRSDIFSFGVILYEMLTGQRAFAGDSSIEVLNAILKEDPPEIAAIRPNVSPAVDRVVRRCLEKAPEERFQSARDLAFALEALSSPSTSAADKVAPLRTARRRMWEIALASGIALSLIGAVCYWVGFRTGGAKKAAASFRQLSYRRGAIFQADFAPDGKTVVYAAAEEGNQPEIFTISSDYPEAKSLGLHDVQLLSVSSKGDLALLTHAVYVGHHRLFNGTLATMPLGGGAPREILENVRQADWTPDGSALAIIRTVNGRDRLEYPIGTVLAETSGYFSDLRFSPDGTRIAYFDHPEIYDDRGSLAVVDLKGNRKTLTPNYWGEEGITWSRSGDEIYFSAGSGYDDFSVNAVDLSGHVRTAQSSAGGLVIQDVAPSGQWLAMRYEELFVLMAHMAGEQGERNLGWLSNSEGPAFSPDSSFIAFTEDSPAAGIHYKVCLRRTDGSPVVPLGDGTILDLSHDGRWVLAEDPTSPPQLMMYPTGPGEPRQINTGNIVTQLSGHWFPDDKRVVLCGSETGHADRCYILNIDGGAAPKPVTPEGTDGGAISPDGKRILVVDSTGKWSIYPLDGGAPQPVPGLKPGDAPLQWSADGRAIIVLAQEQMSARFERLSLADGHREVLYSVNPPDRTGMVDFERSAVSRDEKSFAYDYRQLDASLFLIDNAK